MSPLVQVAAIVAAYGFVRWLLRAIFKPDATCRWCRKHPGKNWWSDPERSGPCWFCHGTPKRRTFGARLVRGQIRLRPGRDR